MLSLLCYLSACLSMSVLLSLSVLLCVSAPLSVMYVYSLIYVSCLICVCSTHWFMSTLIYVFFLCLYFYVCLHHYLFYMSTSLSTSPVLSMSALLFYLCLLLSVSVLLCMSALSSRMYVFSLIYVSCLTYLCSALSLMPDVKWNFLYQPMFEAFLILEVQSFLVLLEMTQERNCPTFKPTGLVCQLKPSKNCCFTQDLGVGNAYPLIPSVPPRFPMFRCLSVWVSFHITPSVFQPHQFHFRLTHYLNRA